MGEIKSTMELVMERTKHMTLSDEEKKEHELKDFKNHCTGLIQKLLDDLLNLEQFERDFKKMESPPNHNPMDILTDVVLTRIDLENDHGALLAVLRLFCSKDINRLSTVVDDYLETMNATMQKRIRKIEKQMKKKYAISGSAVLPNLDVDEEWIKESREIRSKFEERLTREKGRLRK